MKSFSRLLAAACIAMAVFSCCKNTSIDGELRDGANSNVIVKLLDVNRFQVLDTVATDASGAFKYSLDLEAGKPEFIYMFYGDRQVASLLLQKGDKVSVSTDTLGAYSTKGSEESLKLQKVENEYNSFQRDLARIMAQDPEPEKAFSRRYVAYYRDRLAYVMGNSHSLTVVPVLFQQVNPSLPVFSQATDGILMSNICDSLKTVYPESRYVKALEKEAARRMNVMELNNRISKADEIGYIDMALPGIDGKETKLSDAIDKVTMVYFWSSTAEQKMFNLSSLVPIYEELHPKGFQIYAVALDQDKSAWAAAVRNQNLPWVNVCDTRAEGSPYVMSYGVIALPMAWFIVNGEIDQDAKVSDAASIREYIRRKL
ncbi:MAG: TlpA family protein disulfide reductase [Bacteroidales bacterium]|nr:TlpA family protein disulfide reductase [Bacteroidales bacterium]